MSKYGMKQALRESVLECLQFLLLSAANRTDRQWGTEVTLEQAKTITSNLGDTLVAALTFAVSTEFGTGKHCCTCHSMPLDGGVSVILLPGCYVGVKHVLCWSDDCTRGRST